MDNPKMKKRKWLMKIQNSILPKWKGDTPK